MAIVNNRGCLGLLMALATGSLDRRSFWPLPNYRGHDDCSPERFKAAIAKRARKNAKRAMEIK